MADGAYDTDAILAAARDRGLEPVIPPGAERKVQRRLDRTLYKLRYRVEVFFHQIKAYRRIATRYDKTVAGYAAFIYLASVLLWC